MDSLIAMGSSAAILYSLYSISRIASGEHMAVGELYFETAGIIVHPHTLGQVPSRPSPRAAAPIRSRSSWACSQDRRPLQGGREIELPVEEVEVGDLLLVRRARGSP